MSKNKETDNFSIYEASDYWDEHDFSEFDDVKETADIQFLLTRKKYIGIDKELYDNIKKIARELRKPEETLINEWLSEKTG